MYRFVMLVGALGCGGQAAGSSGATGPDAVVDEDNVVRNAGAGQIDGVVLDEASRTPISIAGVTVTDGDGKTIAEAVTDGEGAYTVTNLPPATYVVSISHGSLSNIARDVVVRADQSTALEHTLESAAATAAGTQGSPNSGASTGTLSGLIREGSQGEPFGGVTLEVSAAHLADAILTIVGDNGRFTVRNLRPAIYTVSIYYSLTDKGHVEVRRSGVVVEAGVETKIMLDLDTEVRNK